MAYGNRRSIFITGRCRWIPEHRQKNILRNDSEICSLLNIPFCSDSFIRLSADNCIFSIIPNYQIVGLFGDIFLWDTAEVVNQIKHCLSFVKYKSPRNGNTFAFYRCLLFYRVHGISVSVIYVYQEYGQISVTMLIPS